MLSFAAGQGVIGGVVSAGNIGGRLLADAASGDCFWLVLCCGVGVFVLFCFLIAHTNQLASNLVQPVDSSPVSESAEHPLPQDATDPSAQVDQFARSLGLTPRESDVLAYLIRGRTLSFISQQLFVTTGTVKTHALHIYRKAGVGSREELIELFENL